MFYSTKVFNHLFIHFCKTSNAKRQSFLVLLNVFIIFEKLKNLGLNLIIQVLMREESLKKLKNIK